LLLWRYVNKRKTVYGFAAHGQRSVELALRLPYRDRESFIAGYSSYVHDDRILLFTPSPIAPGTRVRFTLCSITGEPFLRGVGVAQGESGIASEVLFGPLGADSDGMLTLMAAHRMGEQLIMEPLDVGNSVPVLLELRPEGQYDDKNNPLREVSDTGLHTIIDISVAGLGGHGGNPRRNQ
jgi:hypothetical protein